ncbi:ferritin family protein [Archangium sp.]|uniref:ferritin family protein n=1 Tax=Archangium sp. TaxID=1872627 RepID=UPI003899ECC8
MSDTRTSQQWWEETRKDPARLRDWLLDQYRGEATAAGRIEAFRDAHAHGQPRAHRVLTVIAAQERQHATWVGGLLRARGLEPVVQDKAERYWEQPLAAIQDLESGCAVGAHAERMRLERIEVITSDPEAPEDVRAVFQRILPQERFHERAFRSLAGTEALEATREAHELGRNALGLSP